MASGGLGGSPPWWAWWWGFRWWLISLAGVMTEELRRRLARGSWIGKGWVVKCLELAKGCHHFPKGIHWGMKEELVPLTAMSYAKIASEKNVLTIAVSWDHGWAGIVVGVGRKWKTSNFIEDSFFLIDFEACLPCAFIKLEKIIVFMTAGTTFTPNNHY